jgi:glycosyltransferase involved in cell wall biosynthesis
MTNQNAKISVIIPSFNKVRFIGKTLDSIVSQNYQNIEVIIQDGGSTDGTIEIIKKYAQKYPNVIDFESKKDGGQFDAINIGLKKATGDILTFINADDVYCTNAFKAISNAYLINPDSLWFAGRSRVIDSDGKEIAKPVTWYKSLLLLLNSRFHLLATNYLMQPSVFITRKAWKKYGPFTGTSNFVMEYDLWLKIGSVSMPTVINKCLSNFRLSEDNISSVSFENTLKEDFKIVKKYTNNRLILLVHKLNNWGRVLMIKILNR